MDTRINDGIPPLIDLINSSICVWRFNQRSAQTDILMSHKTSSKRIHRLIAATSNRKSSRAVIDVFRDQSRKRRLSQSARPGGGASVEPRQVRSPIPFVLRLIGTSLFLFLPSVWDVFGAWPVPLCASPPPKRYFNRTPQKRRFAAVLTMYGELFVFVCFGCHVAQTPFPQL